MTNIKERILYFIENQGEKKELFFEELGMSYANFKGIQKKSALGSDKIDKILSKYPNLNLDWLFTGQGEMLKNTPAPEPTPQESHAGADELVTLLRDKIALLEKNNASLEYTISIQEKITTSQEREIQRQQEKITSKDQEIQRLKEKITQLKKEAKSPVFSPALAR